MMTPEKPISAPAKSANDHDEFNSEFDQSLKYLTQLSKENEQKPPQLHNQTVRSNTPFYPPPNLTSEINAVPFATIPAITDPMLSAATMHLSGPTYSNAATPKWGCLKNGSLPTFRTWHNITQKKGHPPQVGGGGGGTAMSSSPTPSSPSPSSPSPSLQNSIAAERHRETKNTARELNKAQSAKSATKMRYPKQQRTVRRTHKVGKSKVHPKVSVLLSNRTIRNNITTQTQLLKQTPIEEVKRYLVKKGFIRVGSSSPNDVLRKMHETSQLMCGEIQNHNPDNLLYNFLHDVQK